MNFHLEIILLMQCSRTRCWNTWRNRWMRFESSNESLKPGGMIGIRAGDMGGILIDSESEGPAQGLATYLTNREKNSGDMKVGRKLGRLLRKAGFQVEKTTASYEVIAETLRKVGPSLAAQFANPGYCTLQQKTDNDSLFVALAWCEAIGRAQQGERALFGQQRYIHR